MAVEEIFRRLYSLVGTVSIRTKILGIILALTLTLGVVATLQVRAVMSSTLLDELDGRGHSVVSDLSARSADPIIRGEFSILQSLLTDTIDNHPDAGYAYVLDTEGGVLAHTFPDAVPAEIVALVSDERQGQPHHLHYVNNEGQVHLFSMPILDGKLGDVWLGLSQARMDRLIDSM